MKVEIKRVTIVCRNCKHSITLEVPARPGDPLAEVQSAPFCLLCCPPEDPADLAEDEMERAIEATNSAIANVN